MSWRSCPDPSNPQTAGALDTLIIPRSRDIGGFSVRRALPAPGRQMVGPFIFLDQMGPADFVTGDGIDVRPHPHIGLATVTYLLRGEFQHRDSLGTDQMITPGEVNWMTAGAGITHSERTSAETRATPHGLFGVQTWVALPADAEDTPPRFEHAGRQALPLIQNGGAEVRLILGHAYGARSPVTVSSEMVYADVALAAGAKLPLPDDHEDRGLYVLEGAVEIAQDRFEAGRMMVFRPGDRITVTGAEAGARLLLLGGATLEGPRHIWWNFVSSSREKLNAAKAAWRAADFEGGPFRLPPGDEDEFIPLPDLKLG